MLSWQGRSRKICTEGAGQRVDKLQLKELLMWKNYHEKKCPSKRVTILQSIVVMHPNSPSFIALRNISKWGITTYFNLMISPFSNYNIHNSIIGK
jgi:hypothetical protein